MIMTPHTTEYLQDGGQSYMQNVFARAETAAVLERKGHYNDTARWWRMAADATHNPRQRLWHEARASLCERWHQASFSEAER